MNNKVCYKIIAVVSIIVSLHGIPVRTDACTRAVYLGPDDMIVTGRTMDWKEDPQSNIYFSREGWLAEGDDRQYGEVDIFLWQCRYSRL